LLELLAPARQNNAPIFTLYLFIYLFIIRRFKPEGLVRSS